MEGCFSINGLDVDAATGAAIAAVGWAFRNELFTKEGNAPVATAAGGNLDCPQVGERGVRKGVMGVRGEGSGWM